MRNAIVAEDLRELLSMVPRSRVDVRHSLNDAWEDGYAAAFFDVSIEALLHDGRVRKMHRAGTQLVLLNGHIPKTAFEGIGIVALPQPFRSEDVERVLSGIGAPVSKTL